MKVMFAYANLADPSDAVTRYVRELGDGLERRGVSSVFIDTGANFPQRGRMLSKVSFTMKYCAHVLRQAIASDVPTILVSLDAPPLLRPVCWLLTLRSARLMHVAWVMDVYHLAARGGLKSKLAAALERFSLSLCNHIVVIGSCMKNTLGVAGVPDSAVLPLWCETQDSSSSICELPKALQEMKDRHIVLYSGTARDQHPLEPLLEAAEHLSSRQDLHFVLAGRGPEFDRARSRVDARRLSNVSVLDFLPAPAARALALFASIHFVSLASWATGTCVPSKGYSGLAARRPVIFYGDADSQLGRDLLTSGGGVVVATAVELEESVVSLLDSPGTMVQMGLAGASFLESERSFDSLLDAWVDYLEEIYPSRRWWPARR